MNLHEQLMERFGKYDYLGDGAYVASTGYSIVIFTANGTSILNEVHLEKHALKALKNFVENNAI